MRRPVLMYCADNFYEVLAFKLFFLPLAVNTHCSNLELSIKSGITPRQQQPMYKSQRHHHLLKMAVTRGCVAGGDKTA